MVAAVEYHHEAFKQIVTTAVDHGQVAFIITNVDQGPKTQQAKVELDVANGHSWSSRMEESGKIVFAELKEGTSTNGVWVRDYGPFVLKSVHPNTHGHRLHVLDMKYYRGRDIVDDVPGEFNAWLCSKYGGTGCDMVGAPLTDFPFEGGNILPNGQGMCLVSDAVKCHFEENREACPTKSPSCSFFCRFSDEANAKRAKQFWLTEDQLRNWFARYLGCTDLVIMKGYPYDGLNHVDMYYAFLAPNVLAIGDFSHAGDEHPPHMKRNFEKNLAVLQPYVDAGTLSIERVRMPTHDGVPHDWPRTFLNGVFFADPRGGKRTFLMPTFKDGVTSTFNDRANQAKGVFQKHGWNVKSVNMDWYIPRHGALHCITKNIPALKGFCTDRSSPKWTWTLPFDDGLPTCRTEIAKCSDFNAQKSSDRDDCADFFELGTSDGSRAIASCHTDPLSSSCTTI